jgi:hypothetical protein
MSTPQSIAHRPRLRIGLGSLLTAIGALVAVAVVFLALTGANHPTIASPPTTSQAASGSTPHIHYLGPRQVREGIIAQTPRMYHAVTGQRMVRAAPPQNTCLGAEQRCRP